MYPETKRAVRRVLKICDILWSLDEDDYMELLLATDAVELPDREAMTKTAAAALEEEADPEELSRATDDLILKELKRRYAEAAEEAGFDREHGLAMLEYATLLMDLEEEDDWDV